MPEPTRTILHADLDAFFASVEQRDNPELRGKPVLVGGEGRRGVVAAASYEAREFGCHSAMPGAVARRLCPQAIFVKGSYAKYKAASQAVFEVFESVTPLVEPLSIDEAFLDVTGSQRLLGGGREIAMKIKREVFEKTQLTVSLGVAPNKLVAKIASDLDKPDGLVVIEPGEVEDRLADLEIKRLWGVGAVGQGKLERLGVRTFGQLRSLDLPTLQRLFGSMGESLWNRCRGIDDRPVVTDRHAKSIGHERTFGENLETLDQCHAQIVDLAERVAWRLRRADRSAGTITLKIRNGQFRTITRGHTLAEPTHDSGVIVREALALLEAWAVKSFEPVRLLGVSTSQLRTPQGPGLFDAAERAQASRVDEAADAIRAKFGDGSIGRASAIDPASDR
ncbi:MAG: DNA polymerase IV [Phycisphaerales bacterium]